MSTTGERRLGEKYRYHINGEDIHSNQGIGDDTIDLAKNYFTKRFGVRIYTFEDLEALENSVEAYRARPNNNATLPTAAIERAVTLKRVYFPESKWKWDPHDFNRLPLAERIPLLSDANGYMDSPPVDITPTVDNTPKDVVHENPPVTQATQQPMPIQAVTDDSTVNAMDLLKKYWYIPVGFVAFTTVVLMIPSKKTA